MATVQTVLGPIDSSELGQTLMHEHVRISWHGWLEDSTVEFNRGEALSRAVDQLGELKSLGISTFVDPCPIDLGRDVEFLADVSQRSGINIICATGLYHEEMGFPAYFRLRDVEELAEIYERELREGVGKTGIRPGVIKCATGPHRIGEHEEKALKAAARVQIATSVPIVTHTSEGRLGPDQLTLFIDEGVSPAACVIGHCCANSDINYHLSMLRRGCTVGIDQIGLPFLMEDDVRLAMVSSLIRMGFGDQLTLSQDHVSCYPGRFIKLPEEVMSVLAKRSFTYLLTDFIPGLIEQFGAPADLRERLLVSNPRRIFESATETKQATHHSMTAG